jgi:hypothetical protein
MKVLITTVPFVSKNPLPLEQLNATGINYIQADNYFYLNNSLQKWKKILKK